MVKIQLENGELNVKEGTVFPLNIGVADIRDVSKRSGTFSKSITLVGDDNNNTLLNQYYDVNIVAGTFDINALTKCSVIQNGIPIVEDAFLQLVSVNKVQNDNGYEEGVEYTVLVKDSQADFFTKLDNKELTEIDLTDLNHTYSAANVEATFTNTVTDGYMYPLCFSPTNDLQLTDFKPAVYAKVYWDRIHSNAGFSYEWSFLSDAYFDKLIIPYNGDQPELDLESYLVEAEKSSFTATLDAPITSWTEVTDDESLFNPTTGVYNPPFYIGAGQVVNYHVNIDCDVDLVNATGNNAYLVNTQPLTFLTALRYNVRVRLYKNGLLSGFGFCGAVLRTVASNPLANGTTTLGNLVSNVDIPVNNALPTDDIEIAIELYNDVIGTAQLQFVKWQDAAVGGSDVTITTQVEVNSIDFQATVSSNTLSFGQDIEMNSFIPKKIKQKDFIKSICMMYNLYVEIDKDNPNKFIYKHRDDFYDAGAVKDWRLKLAKDRPQDLQFLPDLSAKKLLMTYKQDSDSYNTNYELATNEIYGQVEFTFDNEYVKGVDQKELIFSPTPTGWNTFGAIVPLMIGASPKNNVRILIHNGTKTCNQFNIYDYGSTGETNLTAYPNCGHFDDPFNPSFDINFAPCDYYYYTPIFSLTNNNLFNLYWRRTVGQINTGKLLTAYFDLNEGDIATLKLSDKIYIDNSYWHINRVVDYDANNPTLTKVELISVDEGIDLPRFKPKKKITSPIQGTIGDLANAYFKVNNVNYSEDAVEIKGVGNLVSSGLKGQVIGDNLIINESGQFLKTTNQPILNTQFFDIGGWDMVTDSVLTVDTGILGENIRSCDVIILNDANTIGLAIEDGGSYRINIGSTNITLNRTTSGTFDDTAYDDNTINRGYVTITYII